jgi:AcrR family transcriptional regulator
MVMLAGRRRSLGPAPVGGLAGLGIGTVFRQFPTKAALLEAVLARRFDRLREQAEGLLDAGGDGGEAARASTELRRAFGALLQRAQQAGVIRDDAELPEVYALLVGASRAAAREHPGEQVTARMLTIVFDGLAPRT